MSLSNRKRQFLSRLVGYATNPVRVRVRTRLGREQDYTIGGYPVVLPPEHNLPFYQRRDPTYDAYAIDVVRRVCAHAGNRGVLVVDLGANVGDTAVAVLSAGPQVRVRAVEGSPRFVDYLRRNVAQFGDRVSVVDRFVGPVGGHVAFAETGSTGGFQGFANAETVTRWVTPEELLDDTGDDVVVWKSDVDGFDIHILAEHWKVIDGRADVLWFEFDPVGTLGDRDDVERLAQQLADSGRLVRFYDSLGHPMLTVQPGAAVADAMHDLTRWLHEQRAGLLSVHYLDVWAVRPELADVLD